MNKKGISEVVTAILLVLLAIAAVVIVWGVIRGFITKGTGGAAGCASIDISVTAVDENTTVQTVTVKRNPNLAGDVELSKIQFVFEKSTGETDSVEADATGMDELDTKIFNFISTDADPISAYIEVSAYPIVVSDAGDRLCDKPSSFTY